VVTSKTEQRWAELVARNLTLPGIAPGQASQPRRDRPPQRPCDIGLFGNDAAQLDLVDQIKQRG